MTGFTTQGKPVSAACASTPAPVAPGPVAGSAARGCRWLARGALALATVAAFALAVSAAAAVFAGAAQARAPAAALPAVTLAELPPQARETYRLIRTGGPFPHERDGGVFFNRERLLPPQPRGFYRAYTVPTPGATTRGARRIVCGGQQPTAPEACFYTADHYASFKRIVAVP